MTTAKQPERRDFAGTVQIETRADGGAKLVGYASVFYDGSDGSQFEPWDGFVERIMVGAFDGALSRGDDVAGLFNHDSNLVLGRASSGTLRLSVDQRGLRYEMDLPDTQAGRDVQTLIKRGDVKGSSFAFTVTDESMVKENGKRVRQIRGVKLYDVGPVVFPAYAGTSTQLRDRMMAELPDETKPEGISDDVRARRLRAEEEELADVRA